MTEREERARFESEYAAQFGANRDDPRVTHLFNRGEDAFYEDKGVAARWAGWQMKAAYQAQRGEADNTALIKDLCSRAHGVLDRMAQRAEGAGKVDGLRAAVEAALAKAHHIDIEGEGRFMYIPWDEYANLAAARGATHPAPGADGAVEDSLLREIAEATMDEWECHLDLTMKTALLCQKLAALRDARAAQRDGEGKP
jgi:hypothetical protein